MSICRSKRGLVNAVGTLSNWLFGTMDDKDRIEIQKHLNTVDKNNHNLIINSQKQIRINEHFNNTFKQIKNIIESDRNIILSEFNKIKKMNQPIIENNLYCDQLFKIQMIKDKIEHIQDNVASARYGMLHPNILTDDEIKEYEIDINKLQYIKLGIAKFEHNLLIFAIKIPKTFSKVQLKTLIPIPNKEYNEIDFPIEIIFEYNNLTYRYENLKMLNELSISKHCVFKKNCELVKNKLSEIISIDDETIVIKNALEISINQTCNERNLILSGNFLIHFNNCTIKILDHTFLNIKKIFEERFYYEKNPNVIYNFTNKILFQDIVLENKDNIDKITELKFHKNIAYTIIMV